MINHRSKAFFYLITGWVLLPILVLTTYYFTMFKPPLFLLRPSIPGVFLYFHLLTQIITGSRSRTLDKAFGQPFTIRLHIVSATMTSIFLLMHFVVRFDVYELANPSTILGLSGGLPVLGLMVLASTRWVRTPVSIGKSGNYGRLRVIHNAMVPLTVLLWVHVLLSGAHEANPLGNVIVTAYLIFALSMYLKHKRRSSVAGAVQGNILAITRHESIRIITMTIGNLTSPMPFREGQYGYLRVLGSGMPTEEHPFSFSSKSSDSEGAFQITVKDVGDYTKQLYEKCTADTPIRISGPFGKFVFDADKPGNTLFIAGGVGITPFLSIIDRFRNTGLNNPVRLLWLCSGTLDFFAQKTIETITEELPLFNTEFIVDKRGENISMKKLIDWAGDPSSCSLYVCAPPPLMRWVIRCAGKAGFKKKNIFHEAFSF